MRVTSLLLIAALLASSCADSSAVDVTAADGTAFGGGSDERPRDPVVWTPGWRQPAATAQDYGPVQIQLSNSTLAYITRVATPAEAMPQLAPGSTYLTYSLFVEETQAVEWFSLFVPGSPPPQRRPLLTAFHGFGTSHLDIVTRTSFFQEAQARDWFLIAPYQRNLAGGPGDISYGSAQSQLHVEAVIRFVLQRYPIDRDRLYGVGFSMGGGAALSYAARHRSRATGAFAAVINHTGTVALSDEYMNLLVGSLVTGYMETIFGGTPGTARFEWQRSSMLELDAMAQIIPGGLHMAQNLRTVPVQTWFNVDDELAHLVQQSERLDQYLQGVPGAQHSVVAVPGGLANCDKQHCWDTLDQTAACDWLEQQSLNSFPDEGAILADRDGRWEYFDLTQELAGKFSRLTYGVDSDGNSLTLALPENLARIRASWGALGFDPVDPLKLTVEGFGVTPCPIEITGLPTTPSAVYHNSVLLAEDCSAGAAGPSWCFDASTGTIVLLEDQPAQSSWNVQF
jgi:poly(3-hydroxybutyrate) depolymerase